MNQKKKRPAEATRGATAEEPEGVAEAGDKVSRNPDGLHGPVGRSTECWSGRRSVGSVLAAVEAGHWRIARLVQFRNMGNDGWLVFLAQVADPSYLALLKVDPGVPDEKRLLRLWRLASGQDVDPHWPASSLLPPSRTGVA